MNYCLKITDTLTDTERESWLAGRAAHECVIRRWGKPASVYLAVK